MCNGQSKCEKLVIKEFVADPKKLRHNGQNLNSKYVSIHTMVAQPTLAAEPQTAGRGGNNKYDALNANVNSPLYSTRKKLLLLQNVYC